MKFSNKIEQLIILNEVIDVKKSDNNSHPTQINTHA